MEYKNLRIRALKAKSWSELIETQRLIACADLTENDKFILNSYVRARSQFIEG